MTTTSSAGAPGPGPPPTVPAPRLDPQPDLPFVAAGLVVQLLLGQGDPAQFREGATGALLLLVRVAADRHAEIGDGPDHGAVAAGRLGAVVLPVDPGLGLAVGGPQ